ncbi:MAG: hypothetical protein GC204_17865, partial [Chloroflexi bacterium]|nr:hypothetical protein [Chloroflexota bacterium]
MKARHSLLLTALFGLIFSMACTFSTLLPTQTPPPAVEAIPSPAPTRPQSAFIDGRTVSNSGDSDSSGVPVNNTAPLDT